MNIPNLNLSSSASSGAAYGGALSMGAFNVGGGSASGGGASLPSVGAIVTQYWPILAAVGVLWYLKNRKK